MADVTALHERRIADLGNQLANQATEITIRCSHCGEIICKEDEWGEKVPTHMEHCEKNPVTKLVVENAALKVRLEVAEDKLRCIADWCAAYPLEMFPKPNMMEVRALLGDTLLTQLSAYNMRHVCEGIAMIAAQASAAGPAAAACADGAQPGVGFGLCQRRYGGGAANPRIGRHRQLHPAVSGTGGSDKLPQPAC